MYYDRKWHHVDEKPTFRFCLVHYYIEACGRNVQAVDFAEYHDKPNDDILWSGVGFYKKDVIFDDKKKKIENADAWFILPEACEDLDI